MTTHVISYCGNPQSALLAWIVVAGAGKDARLFRSPSDYSSFLRKEDPDVSDVHLVLIHSNPSNFFPQHREKFRYITLYTTGRAELFKERVDMGLETDPLRQGPYTRIFRPEHHQVREAWNTYHNGIPMSPFVQMATVDYGDADRTDPEYLRFTLINMVINRLLQRWMNNHGKQENVIPFLEVHFTADSDTLQRYEFAGEILEESNYITAKDRAAEATNLFLCGVLIPTVNAPATSKLGRLLVAERGIGCVWRIRSGVVRGYVYLPKDTMIDLTKLQTALGDAKINEHGHAGREYLILQFEFPYAGNEHRFPLK